MAGSSTQHIGGGQNRGRRESRVIGRAGTSLYVAAILSVLQSHISLAQPNNIRALPYPFHHLLSIVSNLDGQTPKQGSALMRRLNNDYGLPLAGSVRIDDDNPSMPMTTFFRGDFELNRSASGVNDLPIFALLLRQWHRGEIDQLNGWHTDSVYGLRNNIEPPMHLTKASTAVPLEPGPEQFRSLRYSNLRVLFDADPPPDLTIVAVDDRGKKAVADLVATAHGRSVQSKAQAPYWIEVIFRQGTASLQRGIQVDPGFRLGGLSEIQLIAPSCKSGCNVSILRIERDTFSRQTVLHQMPWLEAWNIRPSIYASSHTGLTLTDTLWPEGAPDLDLAGGEQSLIVTTKVRGLIDQPSSFSYIIDLLHRIGVDFISSYSVDKNHSCDNSRRALQPVAGEFYDLRLAETSYTNDQESTILQLGAAAMGDSEKEELAFDCIYQINLSGDASTVQKSLNLSNEKMLKALANRYYDFDGSIEEHQRIWVPPASTAARYRLLVDNIGAHIKVMGSRIVIEPWKDSTIGRTVPNLAAGTRDLNGLTIYVPDPEAATVNISDTPIETFTRNPPDETGQSSITLVDDHIPTTIIGSLPLSRLGPISTGGATFYDAPWPVPGTIRVPAFPILQVPDGGDGWVSVTARDLVLYNVTHLKLHYRHTGKVPPRGSLFVELVLDDGSRIAISEGRGQDPPLGAGSGWWIPQAVDNGAVTRTLPTTNMIFGAIKSHNSTTLDRPPIPIGRIAAIRIGLKGAARGEGIKIFELSALRPSGDSIATDGSLLLGGRVTRNGVPLANIAVRAITTAGTILVAESGEDGLYYFTGMTKDEPVYIAAEVDDRRQCAPSSAPIVYMNRNITELDIDLNDCIRPPAVITSEAIMTPQQR
jgi:hypothetical protein